MNGRKFKFNPEKRGEDPLEPSNGERADRADAALRAFLGSAGEPPEPDEDAVRDLLADVAHWCDREGILFRTIVKTAARDWRVER